MQNRLLIALIILVGIATIVAFLFFRPDSQQEDNFVPADPDYTVSGERKVSVTLDTISAEFISDDTMEITVSGRLDEPCSKIAKVSAVETSQGLVEVSVAAVSNEPQCTVAPRRFVETIVLPFLNGIKDSYEIRADQLTTTVTSR